MARRKWLTILLAGAFALGVGFWFHRVRPAVYQATALIEMSVRRPRVASGRDAMLDDGTVASRAREIFNTRLERFRSPSTREVAFAQLRAIAPDLAPPAVREMPRAEFSLIRDSNLVRIQTRAGDPAHAAALANAYAGAAESVVMRENREASDMAVAWLQTQAASQRVAIERADRALVEFREQVNLDALEARAVVARETHRAGGAALGEVQNRRVLNRELLSAIDAAELTPESVEQLPRETPASERIAQAMARLVERRETRDALRTRYTERHPDWIEADAAVEAARAQVVDAMRHAREIVQADARLLEEQAAVLERRVDEHGAEVSRLELEMAQARAALAAREREREAADISYTGILRRIEEARLSADENTATVVIVQPADGSTASRAGAGLFRILPLALLLGLAAGGGLALLKDTMEDLLQHDEDVEQVFGVKALAVIPFEGRRTDRNQLARQVHEHKHGHFAEAFAGLRGLLDSGEYREHAKVLLVTSTVPGVGKTVCSTNLGIAFAQRGESVLVVDFDMRRPQLRRVFDIPETQESLLHVLAAGEAARFEALPFPTGIPKLDVICSRGAGKGLSAAEVLGRPFVGEFIAWARARYDRVVLDSPPFGIVGDAAVLAGLSDGVLMILRPEVTRTHPARNAIRHLGEFGAPILGAVVNALDFKKAATFSYYNYYYSHYRYGYGKRYEESAAE